MMRTHVGTIRFLIVLVSVIAVDCGLAHDYLTDELYLPFHGWPAAFRLAFLGSALMANLVVVGGAMIVPGRIGGRPFLAGFVVAGAASILVMQGFTAMAPHAWWLPLAGALNARAASLHSRLGLGIRFSNFLDAFFLIAFGLLAFLPELLIATAGGLLAWALVRRREGCQDGDPEGTR